VRGLQNTFIKYWLPVIAYACLIFYISSIPSYSLPKTPFIYDKCLHLLEFLLFGVLFARAFKYTTKIENKKLIFCLCFFSVCLYALSDEVHQLFVLGRQADVMDFIFDGIGGLIGIKLVL